MLTFSLSCARTGVTDVNPFAREVSRAPRIGISDFKNWQSFLATFEKMAKSNDEFVGFLYETLKR